MMDNEKLAYAISHAVGAPVRQAAAFATLLYEGAINKLDDKQGKYLELVLQKSIEGQHMLQKLAQYLRLENNVNITQIDLNALVQKIGGAEIKGSLPVVSGDERLLDIAFTEVLGNARKFTAPDVLAEVVVYAENGEIVVSDNGIGIEPRHHEAVFELFRRIEPEKYAGTGMGLAIAERALALSGGKIRVESGDEVGTRVIMSFPELP